MHDTLDYYKVDPFFRKGAHDKLTFAMMYEYSERFVNPLSHDEVVHMKGSLLRKMPGDEWQRLANLRTLIGYSITRPGKSVFFMGTELGPWSEWNHDASLEWRLLEDPMRRGLQSFVAAAGALYRAQSSLWRHDHDPSGFSWIDVADKGQSVLSYARFDGAGHAMVVMNLTPVPRDHYRLGAPAAGRYRVALNSDAAAFGGSGYAIADEVTTDAESYHGFPQSLRVTLPPLSIVVLLPESIPRSGDDVAVTVEPSPSTEFPIDQLLGASTTVVVDLPVKRRRSNGVRRTGAVRSAESPNVEGAPSEKSSTPQSSVERAKEKMAKRSKKAKSEKAKSEKARSEKTKSDPAKPEKTISEKTQSETSKTRKSRSDKPRRDA